MINSLKHIIQAIKNFDIIMLEELLDDNKSYQDVSKSLFLKTLKKKFNSAKVDDCNSFDDVFFGICGTCNKGCEGMTFFSKKGYYLDLFIESKDDNTVDDIYVCNNLTNFTDLDKTFNLGFSFCKDQEVNFKPDKEYQLIKTEYKALKKELENIRSAIKLDDFFEWSNKYSYTRMFLNNSRVFDNIDNLLYTKTASLYSNVSTIKAIKIKSECAAEALISYQRAKTERAKVIWLFENYDNRHWTSGFKALQNWKKNSHVVYYMDDLNLTIDLTGYEYVWDYFQLIDNTLNQLMEKYKPLPEHYEQSETGYVDSSLEGFLRLHNRYLDILDNLK